MKNRLVLFWQCVFGPKLYQTYPVMSPLLTRYDRQPTHLYTKTTIESLSDNIFLVLKIIFGIFRVISPLFLFYFYCKGSLTYENGILFLRLIVCIVILLISFKLLRGIGRFLNPTYKTFIKEFSEVKNNPTEEIRQKFLSKFDFSLCHWKPDYAIGSSAIRKLPLITTTIKDNSINQIEFTLIERLFHYPFLLLGYICVNVFGRRLMFPGSLRILRHMMNRALLDGRTNLIVSHRAKRYILHTADGNNIDTIFVDRRSSDKTQRLIITCEGNAGFYEMGCMMTPIEAGYSVLGWNRPGFGESSGYPGTLSEINSIDAVMHYAIEKLHFSVHNIIIFAWSIGGYSAVWTAVHYPDIHGLILDAIFDDVLILAQRRMPLYTSKFVEKTIRYYLDLNNIQFLKLYNGPFYLIRRTQDEIMNLTRGQIETNRANEILFSILPYRYPLIYNNNQILKLLKEYVCSNKIQKQILFDKYCSDKENLDKQTEKYRLENPIVSYPCKFGEDFSLKERERFSIYLIDQYLVDFDSQHCTSLPQNYFYIPNRYASGNSSSYKGLNGSILIGRVDYDAGNSNYFASYIDEVSLVMRAKDSSEILDDATLVTWNSFDDFPYSDSGPLNLSVTTSDLTSVSGRVNQAIRFNSNSSFYQIYGFIFLGVTNYPYSVALWTRPSRVGGAVLVHLSTQTDGNGWCIELIGFSSSGQIIVTVWNHSPGTEIVGPILDADVWTHIVTTFSPTNGYQLYINGTYYNLSSTFTNQGSGEVNIVTLGNILQGVETTARGQCNTKSIVPSVYNGCIDEFRVYSRELNSTEISSLANS